MLTAPRDLAPFRNEPIRDFSDPADRALARGGDRARARRPRPALAAGDRRRGGARRADDRLAEPGAGPEVVGEVDEASPSRSRARSTSRPRAFASWKRTTGAASARTSCCARPSASARRRTTGTRCSCSRSASLDRGRRRYRRGDRLPRVLRARGAAAGEPAAAHADRRRAQPARLPAAGGRGRDPALELRLCDHGRHDGGGDRHRQHRDPQAVAGRRRHRGAVRRPACTSSACRRACINFVPGDGPTVGERAGDRSADALHLVHRLQGRRAADQRAGREDAARAALDQARHRRDGRKGRDRRRRRRRPRRGRRRRRRLGLRVRRPEVLGVLAGDRRRARSTTRSSSKLVPAVQALRVGDPAATAATVGPVVNAKALDKILRLRRDRQGRGPAAHRRAPRVRGEGTSSSRRSFADVAPDARIAQEEIFGPVLAVIKARDFDDALEIANGTEFGLTGAVVLAQRGAAGRAARRVLRRQPLPQPQVHRRAGRRATVRRLQHERNRLESRRLRLLAAVLQGKSISRKVAAAGRRRSRRRNGLNVATSRRAVVRGRCGSKAGVEERWTAPRRLVDTIDTRW